jgi:NAD(P)H dehydrogenase (quinone)
MTCAVIGATGRIGSAVVRSLLARGLPVIAPVRDPGKARELFGTEGNLQVRETSFDRPAEVAAALDDAATVFLAMGSVGIEGNVQRAVIQAVANSSVRQLVRLSVLNASVTSFGINQRAHWSIDSAAQVAGVPYTTIRPAIFSSSLLAAAGEVREARTWTGLADTGRVALVDHRDVAEAAVRVLADPATWGTHHDLTGPSLLSWPDAMRLLSAELGEEVTFATTTERELLRRLTSGGIPPGQAELLIAREWALLAGENDRVTRGVEDLTGHAPRRVEAFLHENRELFR